MSVLLADLDSRIDRIQDAESSLRVQSALHQRGARTVGEDALVNNASLVISIWQGRLETSKITGFSIPGAPGLIHKLAQMASDSQVEQYGFIGEKFAGCIFFDHQTGEFLGDTIVERRPKSQAMLDLEDQMIDPKSLARARAGAVKRSA